MENYVDALIYYKKELEIREKSDSPEHLLLATNSANLAMVYYSIGDYLTALSYYEKTLEVQQKSLQIDHTSIALTHYNVKKSFEHLSRIKDAVEHAEQAVDATHCAFGPNHSEVRDNQDYLDHLPMEIFLRVLRKSLSHTL